MSDGVTAGAVLEHARGVLAERLRVCISKADAILHTVARQQKRDVTELAAAVVASCTSDVARLPRSLYTNDSEAA